ncbi:hypothetical protein BRARA_I02490 [Brassica rapa]|uniref:Ubiquitin-like protease family profile domain-containing protein n=1 Tax=Brassica campestris TaxID=3711 RepID=A0A397Y4M2_BRACM|nr:hypothetical protein BRARA_I02490 [Brassica rapa]
MCYCYLVADLLLGYMIRWMLLKLNRVITLQDFTLEGNVPHIRETIGLDVWEELVNSPIGVVARLAGRESVWSGTTVHYLLCRQMRAIKFSLLEFERFEADQYKEFLEELKVPLGMGPKLDKLKEALAFCPLFNFETRKWLGLLLLQAMGVYCLRHKSRIPFESAIRVFDDEAMGLYPWDRTAYEVFIDSINTLAPEGGSYTISGMTVALLIWAYEYVAWFGENFGRVVNNEDVLLLRWGVKRTRASFDNLLVAEIKEHGEFNYNLVLQVRVRRMVLKDSIEEMFPKWSGEPDGPQLVRLITDIHTGRFVKGFWEMHGNTQGNAQGKGNEKKKKMKGGVSSEAEPPTKKQKKVKTQNESEVAAAGKGSSEKEGSKDLELENKATLKTIADVAFKRKDKAEAKKKDAEAKKKDAETKKKEAEAKKKEAEGKKKQEAEGKKKEAELKKKQEADLKTRKHVESKNEVTPSGEDSVFADVTDEVVGREKEFTPESDVEGCELLRSAIVNEYREKNNETMCMRKNVNPSSVIYDPLASVDPVLFEKLMQHIKGIPPKPPAPADKPAGLSADHESDFYSILIHERPWPEKKYGWHVVAYLTVLIKRSMRNPTTFWSKRIAFVDLWWQIFWVHDFTQFKIRPSMFNFKGNGYEDMVKGKLPDHCPTNLKWYEDVDHLNGCLQTDRNHWGAENSKFFKPLTHMIPYMLSDYIPANIRAPSKKKFSFSRRSKRYTPQNTQIGDCGVYSLKFVECLALGVTFDGINDKNIQGLRIKMAAEILAEGGNFVMSILMAH